MPKISKNEEINKEVFAKRLQKLMIDNKDTSYSLAKYLHLSTSIISRYVNGEVAPKFLTIESIAKKYNVNPLWLRGDEDAEIIVHEPIIIEEKEPEKEKYCIIVKNNRGEKVCKGTNDGIEAVQSLVSTTKRLNKQIKSDKAKVYMTINID